jgi:hypothetical protein
MYMPILLAIIFGVLFVPALLLAILPEKMYDKYTEALEYENPLIGKSTFYNQPSEIRQLEKSGRTSELRTLQKRYKRKEFWGNLYFNHEVLLPIIAAIVGTLCVIFLLISIFAPLEALEEAAYWKEFAPMAESVIEGADSMQTIAIAEEVIEYNKWLAEARASKAAYKNWTKYYFTDLSELDYITFK